MVQGDIEDKPVRIRCCVPHCNYTYKNPEGYSEWICQKHWSATDKHLRKHHFKLRRRNKNWSRSWQRLKKQAIERALGI